MMMTVISAYAPRVGCLREEKDEFWTDLDEVWIGREVRENSTIYV